MPGQIPSCPQVLSGRWVGDDRGSSVCQQPGIAGKGSTCWEKPHNLKHCRNPQQNYKVLAGVFCLLFEKDRCLLLLLETVSK